MYLVYITFPSKKEAARICKILIKEKLAACANIVSSNSLFFWKGKLNEARESIAFLKLKTENYKKLEARVKELHSYELPAILALDVKQAEKKFKKWVRA
ncbi:MAG: divalent-cation tolerance protein CutA [Candidatus Micrarchaeota archaeon]